MTQPTPAPADPQSAVTRVLIVDDHTVVREGIRSLLEMFDDIEVSGEAADGYEALAMLGEMAAESRLPEVAIVDMRMPKMDGATVIARMADEYPDVSALVLTSFDDIHLVRSAISAGCRGYLLKDASPEELVAAVREIRAGEMPIDPAVTSILARPMRTEGRSAEALTPREREIAGLLAQGLSNHDIAKRLVISERTARTHVGNILAKGGFSSRTQAALWAIEVGLGGETGSS